MKPSAILLNTSRGPVIDEAALVQALREGWIAAAGLDVLEQEPPDPGNPILGLDNVVLTPHVAGYSTDGIGLKWRFSVETILALARGQPPRSWVNRELQPRAITLLRDAPAPKTVDPLTDERDLHLVPTTVRPPSNLEGDSRHLAAIDVRRHLSLGMHES